MILNSTIITASASYLPTVTVKNENLTEHVFRDEGGTVLKRSTPEILEKFEAITGIAERRYMEEKQVTSEMAWEAAKRVIEQSGVDKEELDFIYLAHNFGDVSERGGKSDMVPSLASRVKHKLGIKNPDTVAIDMIFGCAGWLQALIFADRTLKSGKEKKGLVIGAEGLSRVCDTSDRDSLLYADGAGCVLVEKVGELGTGIMSYKTQTYSSELAYVLTMDKSFCDTDTDGLYLKMKGRVLYENALKKVPELISDVLDEAGIKPDQLNKILIHQANLKMITAIIKRVFDSYELPFNEDVLPTTLQFLGNSSVATLPTLYDLIKTGHLEGHSFHSGDVILFVSVGAGVNMNVLVYKIP